MAAVSDLPFSRSHPFSPPNATTKLTLNKRSYSGFMIDGTAQANVLLFCVGVCAWSWSCLVSSQGAGRSVQLRSLVIS